MITAFLADLGARLSGVSSAADPGRSGRVLINALYDPQQEKKQRGWAPDVVLVVACADTQLEMVLDILWDNGRWA
jgi:hypothetical protein